jgi:ferredoxin-nitrite reductase
MPDLRSEPFARKYRPDPGPFSRGAVGCTGSEFCNYGIIETKQRVRRWAKALDKKVDTPDDLDVVRMHMSGCSASCAQPQIADIGFRGETVQIEDPEGTTNGEGDNIVEGMDFGLGGALGADNEFLDWVETAVPAQAVVPALEELFAVYTDERTDGERFYEWSRRVGNDRLRSIMQRADEPVSQGVAHGD